jgi:hypothetical protein
MALGRSRASSLTRILLRTSTVTPLVWADDAAAIVDFSSLSSTSVTRAFPARRTYVTLNLDRAVRYNDIPPHRWLYLSDSQSNPVSHRSTGKSNRDDEKTVLKELVPMLACLNSSRAGLFGS